MRIEHLAIWVNDLERMKDFYCASFKLSCGEKYENKQKLFSSYFLSFSNGGTRIELMQRTDIIINKGDRGIVQGLAHIAIAVGSRENVDMLTEKMRAEGIVIKGEPRVTGDGYYESVVLDPEGNYIEITE